MTVEVAREVREEDREEGIVLPQGRREVFCPALVVHVRYHYSLVVHVRYHYPLAVHVRRGAPRPFGCTATMSSSRLRRKLEAEAQKRLAVAQAGGDENAEPGRSRPAAMQRRPLAERRAAHCSTRSALAAESEESFAGDGEDMTMTDCTGLGIIHTSQPKFGGLAELAQPCTPSVGTGSVSQHKAGRRVNVGVDGETPLQLREVVMTPNEERRARTWQPIALSALHEKSEDEVDSAGCGCTDKEAPAGDGDDTTLDITTTNLADFRHRDSLMISHHRRTPGGGAEQCDDDDDQTVSLQTELGRNAPSGCTSRSCAEQHLREEIARLNAVETELRAQSEYERQRREVAEARVLALEVCANAWQAYVRSATAHALALSPQEQMRQHEGGTHDRSEGKASARVQRLEQQIVDMAAELAKLGELKF